VGGVVTGFNISTARHLNSGPALNIGGLSTGFALSEETSHILETLEKRKSEFEHYLQ
jgi:hypothetical protein